MRQHLERRGKRSPTLDLPPIPPGMLTVWRAWHDLHAARRGGFGGPEAIGWVDLDAYNRLRPVALEPWEALAVRALDDAWLDERATIAAEEKGKGKGAPD